MDTRHELQQMMWEVIAEMERASLHGDDDQAQRLERIAWWLVGVLDSELDCKCSVTAPSLPCRHREAQGVHNRPVGWYLLRDLSAIFAPV